MDKRSLLFTALALAIACRCGTTFAAESGGQRVAPGIHEVADQELAGMRGRYIVGDNTVLWFGVEMISTWQTNNGQTLQSALTLGLNFSKNPNQPQVTFVPTVTITTISNALPTSTTPSNVSRSVQSAGLANVGGLTQSVQIAGDGNAASNVTRLNVQNGGSAPSSASTSSQSNASSGNITSITATGSMVNASSSTTSLASTSSTNNAGTSTNTNAPLVTTTSGTNTPDGRGASAGNAWASSSYSNNGAQVNLSVGGQGSVSQWIRPGSLGQTIALTADNQMVTNQMIVSMVTQSINASTSQLAHSLMQSINMNRSNR